jgi:hypothetical protein
MKITSFNWFVNSRCICLFCLFFPYVSFFLTRRSFDKTLYLIWLVSLISYWIFNVINYHINNISSTELIGFKISSINCWLNTFFLPCSSQNSFFYSIFCNQPIDMHSFFLAYTMSPVSCLWIHCRIPIVIIENYSICCY